MINDLWNYQINRIQYDINNKSSMLQGKVITKLNFTIQNKKHVWRKTIEKLPSPLNPNLHTVKDDFIIEKKKNQVTLYPKQYTLIKDGKINV